MKKWHIHIPPESAVRNLKENSDLSLLCSQILAGRGFETIEAAAAFLQCDALSSPFLTADMETAANIINSAINDGRLICIYGDYDCDGVTATAMLFSYLSDMGANVTYRIPERAEGYGLNLTAVEEMHEDGVELIITVDNGITALKEAKRIQELGMDLVITDHHEPLSELPDAAAVVDMHRPDDNSPYRLLCGAGVALKLICALEGGEMNAPLEQYAELAALATVADVVELSGENRYLVQTGLRFLANTERPGLLALLEKSGLLGKPYTALSIAFGLAPRLNAAGRFGTPLTAVQLLLCDDKYAADELAEQLERRNTARKDVEQGILKEIEHQALECPSSLKARVLFFCGEGWHYGVVGIAAARLQEHFGKPTILVAVDGEEARGSMRSFGAFSAFRCLDACKDLLTRYGGHPGAGGFSLPKDNIAAFKAAVEDYAARMHKQMPVYAMEVDKVLLPSDLTVENIESLSRLEPFGAGNPVPVFAILHATLQGISPFSGGKHTRLFVRYGNLTLRLLLFRTAPEQILLSSGDKCNFLVTAEAGEYQGRKQITLIVRDYRKDGVSQSKYFAALQTYEQICRHEDVPPNYLKAAAPTREDLVAVYKRLSQNETDMDALYTTMQNVPQMNYCKFRLALDIFEELGLAQIHLWRGGVHRIQVEGKVDLHNSKILQRLREQTKPIES